MPIHKQDIFNIIWFILFENSVVWDLEK